MKQKQSGQKEKKKVEESKKITKIERERKEIKKIIYVFPVLLALPLNL